MTEPRLTEQDGRTTSFNRKWPDLTIRNRNREEWIRDNGPCQQCGSSERPEVDHIDPATKAFRIDDVWCAPREILDAELAKCQVLCQPCHGRKTAHEKRLTAAARDTRQPTPPRVPGPRIPRATDPLLDQGLRKCSRCRVVAPLDQFNRNRSRPEGYSTECRTCAKWYHRKWWNEHKAVEPVDEVA